MNTTLAFKPVERRFTSEAALEEALLDLENSTDVITLQGRDDLLMDTEGRVQSRYFSVPALSQVCGRLASGLGALLMDLSGSGESVSDTAMIDWNLSTRIYNRLLGLRFDDRLRDFQLLVDRVGNRLEGIVSPGYCRLPHCDFLTLVQSALQVVSSECMFQEAVLCGRYLLLAYSQPEESVRVQNSNFCRGFVFGNGETGESSVRTYPAVFLAGSSGQRMLGPMKRCIHSGRTFLVRAKKQLAGLVNGTHVWNELKERLCQLDVPLAVDGNAWRDSQAWSASWSSRLEHLGIPSGIAERIVRQVLDRPLYKECLGLDMLQAVLEEAMDKSLAVREAMERAAYEFLFAGYLPETTLTGVKS